jgi:hypothetical protein
MVASNPMVRRGSHAESVDKFLRLQIPYLIQHEK